MQEYPVPRVTLVDAQGKVFADSEKEIALLENHFNRPEVQEARLRGKGKSIRFSQSIGVDMLYVAVPIKDRSHRSPVMSGWLVLFMMCRV